MKKEDYMESETELDPKFNRAWEYANSFLYKTMVDEAQLDRFLAMDDIKKKFSDEEREFLKVAWLMITGVEVTPIEYVEVEDEKE